MANGLVRSSITECSSIRCMEEGLEHFCTRIVVLGQRALPTSDMQVARSCTSRVLVVLRSNDTPPLSSLSRAILELD